MAETGKTPDSIRFGRFDLSVETGELRKDGVRLKLSGQAVAVLLLLATNPGKLVTREELQQKLWPGASYGDPEHGLNAAVNRLRETLGDSATEPQYIETVPGRGYRLIAALESPHGKLDSESLESKPEPPKPPWWKRKAAIAAAACIGIAALLYPWLAPRIERLIRLYELQQLTMVPLTALPGFEYSPTFSPDGSQVAFVWDEGRGAEGRDLYVKVIGTDKPLRLTHHGGVGHAAWSPDGRNIAFWRRSQNDSGIFLNDSGIFLISPLGGPERKIISVSGFSLGSLGWSPDGKQLAFLDHPADSPSESTTALRVLSLDSMQSAPVKTDCNDVRKPAFSPRGDYLAWLCADNLSAVSMHLQRLSDGSVTELLQNLDGPGGLAWSTDGRRILFTTGFKTAGNIWEVALARPGHPEKLPIGHDASGIAVSPKGNKVAYEQTSINTNIWRVDLSQPQAKAQKVVASSRRQTAPDYSPDGSQITFESNRSGSNEVWVSGADGSNAAQLSSFGRQTGSPHWSPDGKLIAFDSRAGGEANIYVVDPHGGIPHKLEIDVRGNSFPTWSRDGKWIYFVNGSDAHTPTAWKVPSQGGHAAQISKHEALFPLESPDGHYVYFSRDFQLWRVKTDGTEEQQIQGMPGLCSQGEGEAWRPFGSGIYFLGCPNHYLEIDFFDLNTKKTSRAFLPERTPESDWMGGLPVSRDGKWLLYSQMDEQSSEIMLIENWH